MNLILTTLDMVAVDSSAKFKNVRTLYKLGRVAIGAENLVARDIFAEVKQQQLKWLVLLLGIKLTISSVLEYW